MTLRSFVKHRLSEMGVHVGRIPRNGVRGISLDHDLRALIRQDSPTFFDVGANKGQTIGLLRSIFPASLIYAFEPSSTVFRELETAREPFGPGIKLFNVALGDSKCRREFINYEWSTLSSFLELQKSEDNPFREVGRSIRETVTMSTVDAIAEEGGVREIDLLKIDTQGYELSVLNGASESLSNGVIKNVLAELTFAPLYRGQSNPFEVMQLLEQQGFGIVDFYEKVFDGRKLSWCTALFTRN